MSDASSISNGFDLTRVFSSFLGRIGWVQPTMSGSPVINGSNLASSSGRYFNDDSAHALCTINNIKETQEDSDINDTDFNALLARLDKAVISRCIGAIFNRPQKIENGLVYERRSNVRSIVIPNGGNFCGYRISVAAGDFSCMINTVSLYFNAAKTFNLYLFNDLKSAPVKTQSVTTVAGDQTIVQIDWKLDYIGFANKGGLFYIGYFQDDLGNDCQAIDEQLNLWDKTRVFGAYPFQAPKVGELDFVRLNPSIVFRTYGLNLEVSSFYDFTQTIVQNANMFDEVRCLAMAVVVINKIRNTTRTNTDQRQIVEDSKQLQFDTDLAFPTKDIPLMAGLRQQINRELKRINDNFFPAPEARSVPVNGSVKTWGYDSFDINNLPPRELTN